MKVKYNGTWYNDAYRYSNGCILIKELGKAFYPEEIEYIQDEKRPWNKDETGFFMAYVESGKYPPRICKDFISAEIEAKRLASATGRRTYVLSSMKSYDIRTIKEIKESKCNPLVDNTSQECNDQQLEFNYSGWVRKEAMKPLFKKT